MFFIQVLANLLSLFAVALAHTPPTYSGYTRRWQSSFIGTAGTPATNNWNIISRSANYNNEYQKYTASPRNVRLSGSGTLQLIPHGDKTAPMGWTSGRMETKYTFTPPAGKITRIESSLRLAGAPMKNKQGVWPAFWLMGDAYRHGTAWPASGEIDIMENINGDRVGHGVIHCGTAPGGVCNEPIGLASTTSILDSSYHVWRVEINRRSTDWKTQTITWYKDGAQFHKVTGLSLGSPSVWASLTAKPLYIILNVAIGGDWVSDLCRHRQLGHVLI